MWGGNHNAFPSNASSEMHTHKLFSGNSEQKKVEKACSIIKHRCAHLGCWASGLPCIEETAQDLIQMETGILRIFALSLLFQKVLAK